MKTNLRYLIIAALMLASWGFMATHRDKPTPLSVPLKDFPYDLDGWRSVHDSQFDAQTLDLLKPTDYLAKRYARTDGALADLYVGYHDGASKAGPLHSPKNCLPGAGWYEESSQKISLPMRDGTIQVVAATYRQGAATELFLYWFQVGGKIINDEYALKMNEILNSVRHGRRDTAFIRISVPVKGSVDQALAEAKEFAKAVYPSLKRFLPDEAS